MTSSCTTHSLINSLATKFARNEPMAGDFAITFYVLSHGAVLHQLKIAEILRRQNTDHEL